MDGRGYGETSGSNGRGGTAFRVQNQIRRNAQDMQEYLADLGTWERSIKKKDKQISRRATGGTSSSRSRRGNADSCAAANTPPIRRSEGPVPISSGPAPQQLETASKKLNRRNQQSLSPGGNNSNTIDGHVNGGGPERNGIKAADAKANGERPPGTTTPNASAAGHTHDKGYDKWKKFDIDAALRSVDDEGGTAHDKRHAGSSSSSSSGSDSETGDDDSQEAGTVGPRLTPATMVDRLSGQSLRRAPAVERRPPPPPPSTSPPSSQTLTPPMVGGTRAATRDLEKEERDRGNANFGRGEFEAAIKCYTRCVGMNRRSSLAFSNRAMAYLKLKEFGKAEADSDAALWIDPRHVKSLQRRATARNALGKHRAALGDLQTAADIDPASKEIRKDLSKTLETLKAVVRRAPKRRMKVEGMPLPATKPRGFSPLPRKNDEASLHAPQSDCDPAVAHAGGGAATATSGNAPTTADEATLAPFSSVLRGEKDGNRGGGNGSRGARTTFEELPEEAAITLPPPPEPAVAEPPAACDLLPAKQIDAVRIEGRAVSGMPASTEVDAGEGVALAAPAAVVAPVLPAETTGSSTGLETAGVGTSTSTAVVESVSPDSKRVAAVTSSPTAIAPDAVRPDTSKEKAVASTADRSESALAEKPAKQATKALRADAGAGSGAAHVAGKESTVPSTVVKPKTKKASTSKASAPTLKRSTAAPSAASPGAAARTQQLPITGYQFEHMWRSTEGSLEARLELLRAIPPSSVPKIFRRTPLEVDLLGGVLQNLSAALLPRRPTTALRWLKSLPKASRFGMTVALLGEKDGRAAARELLVRLEATPSMKEEPEVFGALRAQYLLC